MSHKKEFIRWFTTCEKTSSKKGVVGFLIKKRIAKNEGIANIQLFIVSLFFFSVSILIISI
jgi:hypothetical protein